MQNKLIWGTAAAVFIGGIAALLYTNRQYNKAVGNALNEAFDYDNWHLHIWQ